MRDVLSKILKFYPKTFNTQKSLVWIGRNTHIFGERRGGGLYQYTKNPCFNTQIKQRNNEKQQRFPLDSWSLTGESTPRDQSTTNDSPVVPPWINNFPVCSVDSSLFICRGRERERGERGIERGEKKDKNPMRSSTTPQFITRLKSLLSQDW